MVDVTSWRPDGGPIPGSCGAKWGAEFVEVERDVR